MRVDVAMEPEAGCMGKEEREPYQRRCPLGWDSGKEQEYPEAS